MRQIASLLLVPALFACKSGPNYAPATEVSGVDRPHADAANPHDAYAPPGTERLDALLGPLAQEASARISGGGRVAIFPFVLESGSETSSSDLSEYLAEQAAARVTPGSGQIVTGSDLADELARWNRPPELLCSPGDMTEVAAAAGFDVAIVGTVRVEDASPMEGNESLRLRASLRDCLGGKVVVERQTTFESGALGQELYARAQKPGRMTLCSDAPSDLSIDTELALQTKVIAQALFAENQSVLSNADGTPSYFYVEPTELPDGSESDLAETLRSRLASAVRDNGVAPVEILNDDESSRAQYRVQSRLERNVDSNFDLVITVMRVAGAQWSASQRISFLDYFTARIQERL